VHGPGARSSNEINRDEVVADLLAWLGQRIGVRGR
jgi:hypothetical protein